MVIIDIINKNIDNIIFLNRNFVVNNFSMMLLKKKKM